MDREHTVWARDEPVVIWQARHAADHAELPWATRDLGAGLGVVDLERARVICTTDGQALAVGRERDRLGDDAARAPRDGAPIRGHDRDPDRGRDREVALRIDVDRRHPVAHRDDARHRRGDVPGRQRALVPGREAARATAHEHAAPRGRQAHAVGACDHVEQARARCLVVDDQERAIRRQRQLAHEADAAPGARDDRARGIHHEHLALGRADHEALSREHERARLRGHVQRQATRSARGREAPVGAHGREAKRLEVVPDADAIGAGWYPDLDRGVALRPSRVEAITVVHRAARGRRAEPAAAHLHRADHERTVGVATQLGGAIFAADDDQALVLQEGVLDARGGAPQRRAVGQVEQRHHAIVDADRARAVRRYFELHALRQRHGADPDRRRLAREHRQHAARVGRLQLRQRRGREQLRLGSRATQRALGRRAEQGQGQVAIGPDQRAAGSGLGGLGAVALGGGLGVADGDDHADRDERQPGYDERHAPRAPQALQQLERRIAVGRDAPPIEPRLEVIGQRLGVGVTIGRGRGHGAPDHRAQLG